MKKLLPLLLALAALFAACLAQTKPVDPTAAAAPPTVSQATSQAGLPSAPANAPPPAATTAVICIDPGHPSETSAGNVVQNGITEVHIVWVVALQVKALLEAEGYKIVLTKSREDENVTNKERAMIANRAKAAVMIRLHCDASTDSGYAVYAPDRQGTVQGVQGPTADIIARSRLAAEAVHQGMKRVLEGVLKDGGVRGDSQTYVGSRQGALTGSIYSQVPAVLIEMVVLSNKTDAEFIKSAAGQQRLARAIVEGVKQYLAQEANR